MAHSEALMSASDRSGPTTVGSAARALWGSALGDAMDGFDLLIPERRRAALS